MSNEGLDKWIAENVMDWEVEPYGWCFRLWKKPRPKSKKCHGWLNEWHPTESISDAFQVVEKAFPYGFAIHRPQREDIWRCIVGIEPIKGDMEDQLSITVEAETAPLAICLAAKKAIEEKEVIKEKRANGS